MRLFLKLVPFRNEAKMPAEVAICLGHSPESPLWKNYTQAMFDKIVPPVYQSPTSDRSRIQRTRSISTRKCATLQNQVFCQITVKRNNFFLYFLENFFVSIGRVKNSTCTGQVFIDFHYYYNPE